MSCANYQAGWFSAYRHLGNRNDLHAILHLGDYIYEYGPGEYGYGQNDVDIRKHSPAHEILTLADYRQRHAQYKQDPDLQRLHAKYPFIATWDDHEVADDASKGGAVNQQPERGQLAGAAPSRVEGVRRVDAGAARAAPPPSVTATRSTAGSSSATSSRSACSTCAPTATSSSPARSTRARPTPTAPSPGARSWTG